MPDLIMQGSQAERMARGQLLPEADSLPSDEAGYKAALCLLRGRVYAAMENQARACLWYQAALQLDPFCYEAFQVRLNPVVAPYRSMYMSIGGIPVGHNLALS